MKKSRLIYNIVLGSVSLLCAGTLGSCTGEFEKWNTNPNEATGEEMERDNLKTGGNFAQMQRSVFIVGENLGGRYQQDQALEGDLFASYLATSTSWGNTAYNNDHYALYSEWYNYPFNDAYERIMQPWRQIYKATDAISPARAMATVIKVFGMSRITDMYGPIPYSKFGESLQAEYDSQQQVYMQFFDELKDAIGVLTDYADQNNGTYLADYDNIYQGNVQKWIKFANTVRLRLAMRISNVDETKAREEAQAAIANKYGLMATAADDAILHQSSTLVFKHPLWEIGTSWDDEHMSATMDCYLNGYADPRLSAYFQPAVSTGEYRGVRNGIPRLQKSTYQNITSRPNFTQNSDMNWMHAAEAYFLMAEAKMRWGIGSMTPRQYYEEGIRTSFAAYNLSGADTYISSTRLPLDRYTDPSSNRATDVSQMLSMLPVAWDDAAADSQNMERIMIQKWIALYPDGQEAWSEMRRTGMPGWVHIQSYNYQQEVQSGEMISRLKFPTTEYTNNSQNVQQAVTLLGGRDIAGTRLWWDVKR